jgi:hypothetical protein
MRDPARSRSSTGVGAFGDIARDFVEVKLHHVGVGVGQRERGDLTGGAAFLSPKSRSRARERDGRLCRPIDGLTLALAQARPAADD